MNKIKTLVLAQTSAAVLGLCTYLVLGPGYFSGATAMIITIFIMILLDVVHPPAVSTSLSFALRAGDETNVVIFGLALVIIVLLIIIQRVVLWMFNRYQYRP